MEISGGKITEFFQEYPILLIISREMTAVIDNGKIISSKGFIYGIDAGNIIIENPWTSVVDKLPTSIYLTFLHSLHSL